MFYLGSIGSNLQPAQHVPWVVRELVELAGRLRLSPVIVTEPAAMQSCHRFANALFLLESPLLPAELKARFNALEAEHGRDRSDPQRSVKDRTLDLDLLAHADEQSALATTELPGYLQPLWPTLDGQPLAVGECLPFTLGSLQLGHRAATIYRDAGTGEIAVIDD